MKRLLIITYYWPPTGGSGVQRWVKFSKYLPAKGWQPVIYTPENPEQLAVDESLLEDIPPEAEVIKTHIFEPYGIYRKIFGGKKKVSSDKAAGVNPLNHQKKSFTQRFSVWIRGNCFVPDPRVGWVRPSVKYLKKYLKEHPVDAMVTTGPPQSMHLIGLGLKKAFPNLKWLVDFRDPWTKMFYFKHLGLTEFSKRRHYALEQKVLDTADSIIAVSPLVQQDFASATSTKVDLITNGFDDSDFVSVKNVEHPGKFVVTHTGLFASDGNPQNLWSALALRCLKNDDFASALEIRLIGKTDSEIIEAIREHGLEKNMVNLGYLPHDKVNVEQRSASMLMLPLRQEPEYSKVLPGKIFEYLAARRPVLGIGQRDGAAASILRDSGVGEMFEWDDIDGVGAFVDACWEKFSAGSDSLLDSKIDKYSRESLTARLVEIL